MAVIKPLSAADVVHSTFETSTPADNPWAGASTAGFLAVRPGSQPAVDNSGQVSTTQFGPSVAVGDLNGDGVPDLVIGDAHGFIWFFPNSGTAGQPKFTQGEVMPIWFGAAKGQPDYDWLVGGAENIVPRVQLVSLAGTKLLDLIVGNYNGRLFYLHNTGSTSQPVFKVSPSLLKDCLVNTRKDGLLWCNFLCPFLYDWFGTGNLDLIMGDGSYSANSVFLFKNQGNRDQPTFNEAAMAKIIPGMGREHLTPQVVDWNNDGKPDIICGERTGHVSVFLNTSADTKQAVPTFDQGSWIKLGKNDTFGSFPTVTVCDLTGNKLPNLILTNNAGTISYATNIGKPGAPQFGDPVPIHGVNSYPKILRTTGWGLISPHGVANELLVCTNVSVQPEFTPPPNTPFKSALRYYVYPVQKTVFPDSYYPLSDQLFDDQHIIRDLTGLTLREDTLYHISFWIRTLGNITNLDFHVSGARTQGGEDQELIEIAHPVGNASSWNFVQDTFNFNFQKRKTPAKHQTGDVTLEFRWNGQGEVYLDDVSIKTD